MIDFLTLNDDALAGVLGIRGRRAGVLRMHHTLTSARATGYRTGLTTGYDFRIYVLMSNIGGQAVSFRVTIWRGTAVRCT